MPKLTKETKRPLERLSNRLSVPFSICFRYKLQNGYTFSDLDKQQLKEFQAFLNLASQMSFEQVERRYRRKSDTNDTFCGSQVIHYGIGEVFRILGIIEEAQFVVLRLDPTHKYHKE